MASSQARVFNAGMDIPKIIERHYTAKELAEAWGFSENTIRKLFQDQPGVLKIGVPFRRGKRGYVSLRIPESVALSVHTELSR